MDPTRSRTGSTRSSTGRLAQVPKERRDHLLAILQEAVVDEDGKLTS